MRLTPCVLGLVILSASAPAWALKCKISPFNCRVDNNEAHGDPNRKYNDYDKSYIWGLENKPDIKDGEGGVRGQARGGTRINFGLRKTINGQGHVYAFSVAMRGGSAISGWVAESAVHRQSTIAKMPTSSPKKPTSGSYDTDWVVTGGNLSSSGSLALNDKYGNRKVNPNVSADKNEAASDYLVRQWDPAKKTGYVNFLYNLPGVGGMTTDTLPMCAHFKRFKGVASVTKPLYFADSASKSSFSIHFEFGEIDGRRGWITREMLTDAKNLGKLAAGHPCRQGAGSGGGGDDPAGAGGGAGSAGSEWTEDGQDDYSEFEETVDDGGVEGGTDDIEMVDDSVDLGLGDDSETGDDGLAFSTIDDGTQSADPDGSGGTSAGAAGGSSGSGGSGTVKHTTPLDEDDGGCAVKASGATGPGGALGLVLGLGLLARRRRRAG